MTTDDPQNTEDLDSAHEEAPFDAAEDSGPGGDDVAADDVDGDAAGYDEDLGYDEDAGYDEEAEPPRRDPIQRWLLGVVGLIIVVFVAAAVSLVLYVLSMRDAPRTAVERAISSDEVAARENPQDVENWARLALSYASAERWSEALNAIERGRRLRKAAILDLTEADILRMKGDQACLSAYERAIKSGQAEYDAQAKMLREKKGVTASGPNTLVFEAMFGRAIALKSFGREEEAIKQAQKALEIEPTDADLHVFLGELYAKAGRTDEAVAEFRAALRFVPDLEPALEGLRALGEEK